MGKLKGLWIAFVYWYFSFSGSSGGTILKARASPSLSTLPSSKRNKSMRKSSVTGSIQVTESKEIGVVEKKKTKKKRKRNNDSVNYEFNIFDGTNVAGCSASPFAEFVS